MSKGSTIGIFPCIGLSKCYNKEEYIDAAKNAIENYLIDGNINEASEIIIIIKTYDPFDLNNANEIFELVSIELNCEEISCNIKEIEDENFKDKLEIILVGM